MIIPPFGSVTRRGNLLQAATVNHNCKTPKTEIRRFVSDLSIRNFAIWARKARECGGAGNDRKKRYGKGVEVLGCEKE